jgi:hypothetical protein
VAALAALLSAGPSQAQPRRQPRLAALQRQNALHQQQNAVQTAVQQTTALLQSASQRGGVSGQDPGGVSGQVVTPNRINLQQQETALQIALQQTTALLQGSFRQNSALSQTALRQLNTLQTALQQTTAVRNALATQNGQLTLFQLQTLYQEQASLMGLLTSQPPPLPSRTSGR